MYVVDLVERVLRAVPEASVGGGFVAQVNDQVSEVWEDYRWPYYVTDVSMSAALSFSDLSALPVGGQDRSNVHDEDEAGLFDALHVGKTFTIDGTAYTVDELIDADNLYVRPRVSDTDALGLAGSLPRVVFPLPSDFGRLYGDPYPSSRLLLDEDSPCYYLTDPDGYVLRGPASDGTYHLELRELLGEAYTVRYVRRPVACTGPASAVDVDGPLEKVIFQGVLGHVLQRIDARNELHLAQLQQRIRRADGMYARYLAEARAVAGSVGERVGRNRSWGF